MKEVVGIDGRLTCSRFGDGIPRSSLRRAPLVKRTVVVLHQDQSATESDILDWCKGKIAGYKRPKSISFIAEDEMPRTATGKVLHRILRARYANREARSAVGSVA